MSSESFNTTTIYPIAIAQAILAGFAVCLNIPPLIWHCKHTNFAAVVLIFFILLMNLFDFLNALIWPNDDIASWYNGVGFCDIQVKLFWAGTTALPSAVVCIMRKLAMVMDTKNITISPTKAQKRRERLFEIGLCIGFPILTVVCDFLFSVPRYMVMGITGCVPRMTFSWPSIVFMNFPPLLISIWAAYYAVLIGLRLRKYRSRLHVLFQASHTSKSRFLRLFLLALTLMIFILPIQVYFVISNWPKPTTAFSWSETHSHANWTEIALIPSGGKVLMNHWIQLVNGILVFLFFGLGKDATTMYAAWISAMGINKLASRVSGASSHLLQKSSVASFTSFSKQSRNEDEKYPGVAVIKTVSTSSTAAPGDEEMGVAVYCG